MRERTLPFVILLVLGSSLARAESPVTLRSLFPEKAAVFAEEEGLVRLSLPAEVLTRTRPNLSDVRLLTADDRELPYVIESGPAPGQQIERERHFRPEVLDVRRDERHPENQPVHRRETYVITTAPEPETPWELRIRTSVRHFDRSVRVDRIGESGELRPLVEDTSIFRVSGAGGEIHERVTLPLPAHQGGKLRITVEGEGGPFLEPSFELLSRETLASARELVLPLDATTPRRETGRSVVEATRPPGLVPSVLRIQTTTPWFDRRVRVTDIRRDRKLRVLGEGRLFRLQAAESTEKLALPVAEAAGDALRIEIFDGDSPPLEDLRLFAVVPQPALVFFASRPSPDEPVATLFFGGRRAERPRYDLEGLLPEAGRPVRGERAEVAGKIHGETTTAARLGEIRKNPEFDPTPALAFAMRPGSIVDPRLYTHRRTLDLDPSAEGIALLRLSAEEASVARTDLADVRVVDPEWRQWPYLPAPEPARIDVAVPIDGPDHKARTSRYELRLPAREVELDRLELDTDAPFASRPFRLLGARTRTDAESEEILFAGRLVRSVHDSGPLRIDVAPARVRTLSFEIEDGGEAPLRFTAARVRIHLPELFVTAPAGKYFLLVGNPRAEEARYDLALVRDVVLAVEAKPVPQSETVENPAYSLRARLGTGEGYQLALFWGVLITAVAVLAFLTLRLVRRTEAPD